MIREFTWHGEPRGQGRPRFVRQTGVAYKSSEDKAFEKSIMLAYKAQNPMATPVQGAFGITLVVKLRQAKGNEQKQATKKPDIDNVIKSVLDALNGVAFADDKNCVNITAYKRYDENPGISACILEVE